MCQHIFDDINFTERNINFYIRVELVHMMAALMKRASIAIIPPVGLLSSTEYHFREGLRGPKRKKLELTSC